MLVLIRGAGDLASGIALRLFRSHFEVIMTDLEKPTSIRRTVCFSEALIGGSTVIEGVEGVKALDGHEAFEIALSGKIAVVADPECEIIKRLKPDVVVDAILAKRNIGTKITDAPVVIGVGPGFTAGRDCHAVIETMRGHTLGRVIHEGSALPNTGIPGLIGGFSGERVLRAPATGEFVSTKKIRDMVSEGDVVGYVDGKPMKCTVSGVLRGLIADGTYVTEGMKSGDVDPRGCPEYCDTVSDKALAVAGGVLEAILNLSKH